MCDFQVSCLENSSEQEGIYKKKSKFFKKGDEFRIGHAEWEVSAIYLNRGIQEALVLSVKDLGLAHKIGGINILVMTETLDHLKKAKGLRP